MRHERISAVDDIYNNVASKIDAETLRWSGNYSKSAAFQDLLEEGENVLPFLLEQIAQPDVLGFWWRAELVWTLADSLGIPVEFDDERLGELESIRQATVEWGETNGFYVPQPEVSA